MSSRGNRKMTKDRKPVSRRVSESGEDLCPVCNDVVIFYAVGTCDHFVCYRCSTRMRSLCDQMYCAICRTELPKVVFIKGLKKFEEIETHTFLVNRRVNVYFENEVIRTAFNDLLEHRCPLCAGRKPFRGFPNLREHMRKDHNLFYCDLCVGDLRVFTHERRYYDRKKLAEHRRVGDADDKSHKGHPLCEFCDERFVDNDELVRHLRKEHYFCHFCEADGINNQFYSDYPFLRDHFREAHFLCEEDTCVHVQFTNAFRSNIDLKAHVATEHGRGMRKSQQKQMRTVDIDIQLVPRAGAPRRNNYERGGGRQQYQRRDDRQRDDRQRGGRDDQTSGSVVSGADFEEVAQDSQHRGGFQQRTKRQQKQADRETEDVARAVTASVRDMQRTGHVGVVDEAAARPQPTAAPKLVEERFRDTSEDFPTLDGRVIGAEEERASDDDVTSGKDPGRGPIGRDTMAKKVARANKFSVAESKPAEDDFPSLGGGGPAAVQQRPSAKAASQYWQAPIMEEDFPTLGGATADPAPIRTAPQQRPIRSAPAVASAPVEDFPALGGPGGRSRPQAGLPLKQNTWVPKPATVVASSAKPKPKPQKPATQKGVSSGSKPTERQPPKSTFQDYPTLGSIGGSLSRALNQRGASSEDVIASAPVPSNQQQSSNVHLVKSTDSSETATKPAVVNKPINPDDFPSLGGGRKGQKPSSASGGQWGPKPKPAEPEKPQSKSEQSEGQFMVAKLKNKNKKKANVNRDLAEESSGSLQGSDSEAIGAKFESHAEKKSKAKEKSKEPLKVEALSSVDKEEDFIQVTPRSAQTKSKKKKGQQNTKENKSAAKSNAATGATTTPAADTPPSSRSERSQSTVDDVKVPSLTSALVGLPSSLSVSDGDFPALMTSALKDQSNLPDTMAEMRLDDFPSLGLNHASPLVSSTSGRAPPPPGFIKPEVSLGSSPGVAAPPPGFGSVTQSSVAPPSNPEFSLPSSGASSMAASDFQQPPEEVVYEFNQPPNYLERNQNLIAVIQRYVKDDDSKFTEFKSCSGQFRTNKMGPYDYYDRCSNLLGKDNFRAIFPELLVLLPDIQKQQDLLNAHNAAMRLSDGKKSQGKSKKLAMWSSGSQNAGGEQQLVACGTCKQVVLQPDLAAHQGEHRMESDFPSLGATTAPGAGYGMSAWVRAK